MEDENKETCKWITEGFLGEVSIVLGQAVECKILIDPVAPFKIEIQDVKCILLVPRTLSSCINKRHVNAVGSRIMPLRTECPVSSVWRCDKSMLIQIKANHQKIRFGFDKDFRIVSVTAI